MRRHMTISTRLSSCCIGRSFSLALAVLLLITYAAYKEQAHASLLLQGAEVVTVNDGDTVTIRMNGKTYRTRLIGLDAPEMGQEPWGEKAKVHLKELMKEAGGKVYVETDVTEYDKYDRLLVYLWSEDKRLINEQMVLDGYAVLFTIRPNGKYADRFRKAQHIAREKKINIWGPDGLKERPIDYKKKHPREQR